MTNLWNGHWRALGLAGLAAGRRFEHCPERRAIDLSLFGERNPFQAPDLLRHHVARDRSAILSRISWAERPSMQ